MRSKALVLSFLLFAAVSWAESSLDKMVGTWKYVPEKAVPPDETIASEVIKIEKVGPNTIREETDQVMKSGQKQSMTTTQVCDGKENHSEGAPEGSTWICDPQTNNFVLKRNGKVVMDVKTDFSADGRTVTFHRKRLGKEGQWVEDTRVWEKQ